MNTMVKLLIPVMVMAVASPALAGTLEVNCDKGGTITKVYETDPLVCPRCGGAIRILAFIDQPEVVEKILTHLGLWPYPAHAPPSTAVA